MDEDIPKVSGYRMSYFTLPPVDEDTKQKLLNVTCPSYFNIDLKHIQMLKVDVASFSSCLLFAIITDIS